MTLKIIPTLPIKHIRKRYPFRSEQPRRMAILLCTCGNKYIKTREDQLVCVKCLNKIS